MCRVSLAEVLACFRLLNSEIGNDQIDKVTLEEELKGVFVSLTRR